MTRYQLRYVRVCLLKGFCPSLATCETLAHSFTRPQTGVGSIQECVLMGRLATVIASTHHWCMNHDFARACVPAPVGPVTVTASRDGLRHITFGIADVDRPETDRDAQANVHLNRAVVQIEEYFAGERTSFSLPLDWVGVDAWPLRVLKCLADTVGYGSTITYGELAARCDRPKGAQAVGGIMSRNPLPVVVPCHRVVASNSIGGFAGSGGAMVETKRRLLQLEGSEPTPLF